MAWAVQTDGVNDQLKTTSTWIPTDLDNWSVEILARRDSGNLNAVLFASSDFNDGIYIHANTDGGNDNLGFFVGGVPLVAEGTGFNVDGLFHEIVLNCVAGVFEVIVDSVSYGTATKGATTFSIGGVYFGVRRTMNSWMAMSLQYATLTDSNTPSNSRLYDATSSSHGAGTPILTDTIGGNNATGVNMPTDGSAWIDLGGGGISITGATANYNYSGIDGSVDLTGEIIVTGATASYSYDGINGSVDLTGEVVITGQTANYNYAGIDGEIELTGLITVTGQTANYNYDGIASDIILQGSIIITGSTANYDYNALNGTIILQGPITVNPKNIIRVARKSNEIAVKRNSNKIIVR